MSISSADHKPAYVGPLSPEYALLGLLLVHPDHGYNLHQRMEADLGQVWHISLSQIYNILNRLKAQGFVRETRSDREKRPSRRPFQLTPAGRERFQAWFDAPTQDSVRAIRVEFTTRLYFASLIDPAKADPLIQAQITTTQAGLRRLSKTMAELSPEQRFNRLGLELRINQLESIIAWLGHCRAVLSDISSPPSKRDPYMDSQPSSER